MHNRLRQMVAVGSVRGQPLAKNMKQMVNPSVHHVGNNVLLTFLPN